MEKQYCDGKEIVSACSWCAKEGVQTYLKDGQKITDELDLWDIEDKLDRDIAVISHTICSKCAEALYPDMCHDDNLTLLK
jgi:hypothetical protein